MHVLLPHSQDFDEETEMIVIVVREALVDLRRGPMVALLVLRLVSKL